MDRSTLNTIGAMVVPLALLAIAAITVVAFWMTSRHQGASSRLLRTGLPAEATVLSLRTLGMTISDDTRVELTLEVRPSDGPPYQTTIQTIAPRPPAKLPQPGETTPVRYDPNNPSNVAIVPVTPSA